MYVPSKIQTKKRTRFTHETKREHSTFLLRNKNAYTSHRTPSNKIKLQYAMSGKTSVALTLYKMHYECGFGLMKPNPYSLQRARKSFSLLENLRFPESFHYMGIG